MRTHTGDYKRMGFANFRKIGHQISLHHVVKTHRLPGGVFLASLLDWARCGGVPQETAFCAGREVPLDLGDEVAVQGSLWGSRYSYAGFAAANKPGAGCGDRAGVGVSGPHPQLVSVPPQLAPAKLAQYLKGRSSRMLQGEFPQLKKRWWGSIEAYVGLGRTSARAWARWTKIPSGVTSKIRREDPGENFKITFQGASAAIMRLSVAT